MKRLISLLNVSAVGGLARRAKAIRTCFMTDLALSLCESLIRLALASMARALISTAGHAKEGTRDIDICRRSYDNIQEEKSREGWIGNGEAIDGSEHVMDNEVKEMSDGDARAM